MTAEERLSNLLIGFLAGRTSVDHVAEVERLLVDELQESPLYDKLIVPVTSYAPGGGEYLYDATQLAGVFRDALTDMRKV